MDARTIIQRVFNALGYHVERIGVWGAYPILRPISRDGLDVLADATFQQSCRMLGQLTLLDTPRLANLWVLCRLTDPAGAMVEIGTYKGGGALHLSNCCPERELIVCDPFDKDNFECMDPRKDALFCRGQFADTTQDAVQDALRGRKARIIPGYFPASVKGITLPHISFVHLDVDVYHATKESLTYLLTEASLYARSLIVVDDFNRSAEGVDTAVQEVLSELKGTLAFPLFPGQALVVPKSWYQ